MKNSKKLMMLLFCISTIGFSNHGRYEQYWSDYEDFANNRGKFKIGQKGVIVYKKDGLAPATIDQPIPNFDGMVDGGAYALWGDSQILSTASHVGNWGSFTFIQRHLRKDVELSEGFKDKAKTKKEDIVKEYSERVKMPYMRNLGNDYSIGRLGTIAFDGYTPETIKNRSQIHVGDLVARTGGGVNSYAHDGGERYPVGYGNIAGGLNKIYYKDGGSFWIQMSKDFKTPLDSASRPGDSGSPAYIWDATNQKWLLAGENSAGSGDNNWNKKSIIKQNPDAVNAYLKSIEDEKIEVDSVELNGKTLSFGGTTRVIDDNVATAKNQTFAKDGLTLTVNSDSDTGASRFRFSENATITGTGKFGVAGLMIDKDVNVNYNIISDNKTIIRKRGEGSLTLNGTTKNDVEVNIGEGSLILDNSNGYAASHIRVAQGAKVILNKDNQLNDNKIYFGHRGGTLELKGHNLEFNDIYHLDKDAVISNKESTTKSKFTFTQGKDRVFLGKFSGNMDVEYNPDEVKDNAKWNLRGNTEITGDLNVKKGTVSISGDVITSGYENNVLENQFEKTTFKAGNINIDSGSTLQIDRATKVESDINVSGKLDLTATGEVLTKLDATKPYLGYEDQSEVNKVNVNGNITFNDGASNNFNATVENNNLVEINSKISGAMNGIKDGNGLLKLTNVGNNFTGSLDIKDGVVESENENILSNGTYKIEEKGLLRVNDNSNLSVLDKIDITSNGVISLGKSLSELDRKYANYTNLYIGSKNNITIGADDKAIDNSIRNINLGGDNGTITLKGLELEDGSTLRNINAGNNKHRGNVVIDGLSSKANVNISIRDGINFVVNKNSSSSKFLDLGYGATAGNELHNNLKDSSIGVLELTNENSINVKNIAVGAKKGSDVTLNTYTTTNDKTRFSGEGNLTYTAALGNKDLEVDAQNLSGGVVTLTGDNKDFTNKVTVMGNKNGENKGDITLKLGSEMLKHKNEVLIKDGGILDINNNDVSIKLNNASNKYGTLTNSGTNKANVTLDSNEATTINTTLTGNLNIVKQGTGTIKFDNKNNFKGNVVMNGGELIYDKDVLENDVVLNDVVTVKKKTLPSGTEIIRTLHGPTKLTISSNKSNGDIKSSFGLIKVTENANININSVTALKGYNDPVYSNLNINGVSRDRGSLNIGKVTIADGANMYVTNQRMTMQSLSAEANSILTLDQASLKLVYSDNTILNSGLKELELKRSKLYLRDYKSKIEDKNSSQLTKVVISASNSAGDSEIINGESYEDNGGGGGATFVNPIVLRSNNVNTASLIFKSGGFFGSGTGLTINSKVSGEGIIKVRRENNAKFEIQDNFKDFTGKLMSDNQPDVNYDYNISSNNDEDRVIGYNLTGVGSYTNKSNKDLTFTNLDNFTGKLVAQNGDIILKDDKAINNTGKVETYNNTNITLLSNNNIDANNLKLENKNTSEGNTNKVIKDGSGKLSLGANTNITNFKTFEVKSGELELKKNIEVSNIDLKDNTKLDLNLANDGTITSEIKGTGDLIKTGTTKVDIVGSKLNNTGSIDLQAGELSVTGDKVLSNKVKGSADLTFKDSNVEVKDIENFSGNLNLDNANLTLKEDKAFDSEAKIKAKGTSNVTLDITGDKTLTKLNVENQGSETNKLEKTGLGKLTLGENANIVNYKNLDIKAGTLEISKNIPIENVNVDTNTKLNVNNAEDVEMASNIKGAGDIVKLGEGKLNIASSKLNSAGSIDLQAGELSITGDKVLSNKVKGTADLTFKDSNVEVKDIENFSGNLNLDNANLTLKEDKAFDSEAKIKAKGTSNVTLDITGDKTLTKLNVENQGSETNKLEKTGLGKLTLGENINIVNYKNLDVKAGTLELTKNVNVDNLNLSNDTKLDLNLANDGTITSEITGTGDLIKTGTTKVDIEASKLNNSGNIVIDSGTLNVKLDRDKIFNAKLKGTGAFNVTKDVSAELNIKDTSDFGGNINLTDVNLTLDNNKALNSNYNFDGNSKLKLLNDTMYKDMTVSVNSGKLNIDSLNKVDAKISVAQNSELTFTQENNNIGELTNNGTVKLFDQRLTINNYISTGIFEVTLNKMLEDALTINNSNEDINVNLNLSADVLNKLGQQKLRIANTNRKFNVLNLDNLHGANGKKVLLSNEAGHYYLHYELAELLRKYDMRLFSIIDSNMNLVDMISKVSYSNFIDAKYLNQNDINNNNIVSNYTDKINSKGISVEINQTNKEKNLAYNVEFIYLDNKVDITGNDKIESNQAKYKTFAVIPKIGYKNGIFDISTSLGVIKNEINIGNKVQTVSFINNINVGINPKYEIGENTKLTYINNLGYSYIPLNDKEINDNEIQYNKIKSELSSIYYETGISAENKYMGMDFITKFKYNNEHTQLIGQENIEKQEKYFETNMKLGLSLSPINNFKIKAGFETNLSKIRKNKNKFDLGFEYKW